MNSHIHHQSCSPLHSLPLPPSPSSIYSTPHLDFYNNLRKCLHIPFDFLNFILHIAFKDIQDPLKTYSLSCYSQIKALK